MNAFVPAPDTSAFLRTLAPRLATTCACALASVALCAGTAAAAEYHYVDWQTADVAAGTASGTITLPDDSTVTVTFEAVFENGAAGNLYGAQVSGGTNYWNPAAPYMSAEVENAPPTPDILRLAGGQNQIYKVTLSEPIRDPIMAIVSLGQPSIATTYNFDSPFTIVSQGAGYWGGSATALQQLPDNVLQGREGHGTIRFIGTFSTFSWTVPTPETWHGFTFGIRTVERLDPSDAGAADAGAFDGAADVISADSAASDAPAPLADAGSADASARDAAFAGDAGNDGGAGLARGEDGCSCRLDRHSAGSGGFGLLALFGLTLFALRLGRRKK